MNIGELLLQEKMVIEFNGPSVEHYKVQLLPQNIYLYEFDHFQNAINLYFRKSKQIKNKSGHFVMRADNAKKYLISKSVDNLRSIKPRKKTDYVIIFFILKIYVKTSMKI